MALFLGMFTGNVLGMMLFGAAFGWIVRKFISGLKYATSDLFGLVITVPIAAVVYSINGDLRFSLFEMLVFYGYGAFVAYLIMRWARDVDARRTVGGSLPSSTGQWARIGRSVSWIAAAVSFAFGATALFAAFQGPSGDSVFAFFIGVVMLMVSAAIWRVLTKKSLRTPPVTGTPF